MSYVYGEERVNAYTVDYQYAPSVSPLAGGGYVVVWTSREQDGSNDGIYAQRFTASGLPTGPEFRVNTTTANHQLEPRVAGLSDGSFAVVWTDRSGADGSSYGVYMQRVSASGQLLGGELKVNTFTSNDQGQPSIAAYGGGYVVTWYSNGQDGSGYGVYAQRFDNAGTPVLTGGSNEFRVNTTTGGSQYEPDVAAATDGSFVVVWRSDGQDGSGSSIQAQRYNADGSAAGGEFRVNSTTANSQYEARVAALEGGGFVVVWRSDSQDGSGAGVYGQRYDAAGAAAGGEFRVNESTAGGQYQPDVSALPGGGFAVTWYNDNYDGSGSGSYQDVYVREYAADGTALGGQLKANTPTATQSTQSEPAVASLGSGNYVVVWRSEGQDGSQSGVYQQLFGDAAELPRQSNPELGDFAGTLTFGENLVNATPQIIDPAVSLLDLDSANLDGGRVEIFYTQFGSAEDQLGVRNQGTGVAQIGVSGNTVSYNDGSGAVAIGTLSGGSNGGMLTVSLNANASVDAVEALIQNLTYANSSNSPQASRTIALRVYDGDGGTSDAGSVQINVTREEDGTPLAHAEEQLNTYAPGTQQWPAAATLADGSYVVAWQSNSHQDGATWGIYAQRFAANGEAIGPELRVNTLTDGGQSWAQVAALSTGGYVITWQDDGANDGSGYATYGQRFDATGSAIGAQFLINTTTSGNQYQSNVAAYTGGFAAVWTTGSDIYQQRFTNDGVKVGGETLVSTVPGGAGAQGSNQYLPDVAAYANGNLVVVWADGGSNDGSTYGVYGRLYDAGTGSFGSSFLVNTTTASYQTYAADYDYAPNVAVLASGDFVVVWPSYEQDGSGWGVIGQRFNAAGVKQGGEFVVNETTAGSQYIPEVTALSTGGFVVGFYNDNYDISGAGTTADAYIREYDASANPIDGQRKLESPDNSTAGEPTVVDLGGGNFAVVYNGYATSANGGNNTYEIRQQLFGSGAALARSESPQLGDFS
ncbi:hypothetical protein, partial [Zoogloea sp.]|uniref:hypothetical protein n=1 Tax=Zoogloea sp. TaxID=49181 RepID=UPI0026149798